VLIAILVGSDGDVDSSDMLTCKLSNNSDGMVLFGPPV
jgi:hypothetical protein